MQIWSNLLHLKNSLRVGSTLFALVIASVSFAEDPLSLDVTPIFEATRLPEGNLTVNVIASNKGADARGAITLQTNRGQTVIPMDLPRGSQKKVTLNFTCSSYEPLPSVRLDTNRGTVNMPIKAEFESGTYFALISQNPGGLNYLRGREITSKNPSDNRKTHDIYCRPAIAPERAASYQSIGAIFLGEGSERLTDAQVEALKYYVIQGGRVVFIGGPSSPVLADSRWRGMLPAVPTGLRTLELRGDMIGKAVATGKITLTTSNPVKGATVKLRFRDNAVLTERRFGMGTTFFLAFDPVEEPARNWKDIDSFVVQHIGGRESYDEVGFMGQAGFTNSNPAMPPGPTLGGVPMLPEPSDSLFDVEMPAWHEVTGILCVYVLVIPLHLLILRKLKRGELAWFTTPVLSIIFAGVFFRYAGALYSVGQTYRVNGSIVTDSTLDEAYFSGGVQAFFPSGGDFVLGLKDVEEISSIGNGNSVSTVDNGDLTTTVTSGNLTFHDLFYRQKLPNVGRLVVQRKNKKLVVINQTRFTLSLLTCYGSGSKWSSAFPVLKPGAQAESLTAPPDTMTRFTFNGTVLEGYDIQNLGKVSAGGVRYVSTASL